MSALPPIADMCSATRYVRFVPKADMGFYKCEAASFSRKRSAARLLPRPAEARQSSRLDFAVVGIHR